MILSNEITQDPFQMGQHAAQNDDSWLTCPFVGGSMTHERELWLAGYHGMPRPEDKIY